MWVARLLGERVPAELFNNLHERVPVELFNLVEKVLAELFHQQTFFGVQQRLYTSEAPEL